MKMFMYSLYGDACQWYFSVPPSNISSLKDFHRAFTDHCKRYFSDEFVFGNCCDEYELHHKVEDVNRDGSLPHNMQHPFNDLQDDVLSHQHELERDNKGSEGSSINIIYDFHQSEEYAEIGDISFCDQYISDLQDDNHSIDAFDIVSNAFADLWCQEDQFVPFENLKDNE